MASKPKAKAKARKPAGKRWMIVASITAFWAAVNEPAELTMGSGIVWALTALAVGLVVMAVLALLGPAAVLAIRAMLKPKPPVSEADET